MLCALSMLTAFTLYTFFVYGLFGARNPFNVVEPKQPAGNRIKKVEVKCYNINIISNVKLLKGKLIVYNFV